MNVGMMDIVAILMLFVGILLGAKQRFIRVLISSLIVCLVIALTAGWYSAVGNFFVTLLRLPRNLGDGVAFFLTSLTLTGVFEIIMRKTFANTYIVSLRFLDNVAGALMGVVWGLLLAGMVIVPLNYAGMAAGDSLLMGVVKTVFRGLVSLLHLIYPPGSVPLIEW